MSLEYKKEFSFDKRKEESGKILNRYPDRIPIIVEKGQKKSKDIGDIDKKKYLVPCDLTVGQFQYVIRKRIKLSAQKALFIFVNDKLPTTSQLIKDLYENEKDKDGFLYIKYAGENTFG